MSPGPGVRARLAIVAALAFGLAPTCAAERYTFRAYGQADGLQNLSVNCAARDRKGFLWVGTESGLFRYDGSRFQRVDSSEINVHTLFEDSSGRLWVGAVDGLYYIEESRLHPVQSDRKVLEIDSASGIQRGPDGQLLVLSRHDLLAVSSPDGGRTWEARPFAGAGSATRIRSVSSFRVDASGTLWAASGTGIRQFGRNGRIWGEQQGLPADNWQTIFFDNRGTLWARSQNRIVVLAKDEGRFTDRGLGADPKALSGRSTEFNEDAKGRVLTTFPGGILRWEDDRWRLFTIRNGLGSNEPSFAMIDREDNVWIGIVGHGLTKWLGYGNWEAYTTAEGLQSDLVWATIRDSKGRVWVANEHGLAVKGAGDTVFRPAGWNLGALTERIRGFTLDRDGAIWFGNKSGSVIRFDPDTGRFKHYRLTRVYTVFADDLHGVWIATADGLFLAPRHGRDLTPRKATGAVFTGDRKEEPVRSIVEDAKGRLWAGVGSNLARLDGDTWHVVKTKTKIPGRISDLVAARDGSLWISGWFSGVIRLRNAGEPGESAEAFSSPDLSSNQIYFIGVDRMGRFWAGSDVGVDVFDGTHWSHFSTDDGLIWNDCDGQAFYADPDGSVWIGTSGGLSHVTGIEELLKPRKLNVLIDSAKFGSRDLLSSPAANWSQAPFVVSFAAPSFRNERAIAFQYRLSGVDREWVQADKNQIRYPEMGPGAYRFEVQSIDRSHGVRSPVAGIAFRIEPPWWRTKLFYGGLGILGLAAISAIWWWRNRVLMAQKHRLELLVQERTRALADRTQELEREKIELLHAREALQQQATHDGLTGLWNRTAILDILRRELNRGDRARSCTAVILADIDHFKSINDQYGHLGGDAVLRSVSARFAKSLRSYDSIGRYGGEEFLVVMPNWNPEHDLARVEQLRSSISDREIEADEGRVRVCSSFGVSWTVGDEVAPADLLRLADQALYRAKALGRNRVECGVAFDQAQKSA